MRMLVFAILLFGCFFYALARGGWPERLGALSLVAGSLATVAVNSPLAVRYASIEILILIVDVAVLLAFLALALLTDRYWPLWTTALQLLVVLGHAARLVDGDMVPTGYGFLLAVWSYPQLAILAAATWSRHRSRKRTKTF
jgi:hypothetical protein